MKATILALIVCWATAACSSPSSVTAPTTVSDSSQLATPTAPAAPPPVLAEPVTTPAIRSCSWAELQVPVGDGPPHMAQEFLPGGLVQIRAMNTTTDTICEVSYTSWEITNPGRGFLINQQYVDGALYRLGPGESRILGPIRSLGVGCTQQDIANSTTLATRAEQLHAFYYEVKPWKAGACDEPRPPAVADCIPGVTVTGTIKRGAAQFTVHAGPVTLSIVAFAFNGKTFLPQFWIRQEVKTWGIGTHAWSIQPEYQEDLFCGVYPAGTDLTDANIDYWHARKIDGDFR